MTLEIEIPTTSDMESDLSNLTSTSEDFLDDTTIVTFSVMFYYTPDFAAQTDDVESYFDEVVDITNEGKIV